MPVVTILLVAANFLAYLFELEMGGQPVCNAYGLIPAQFMRSGDLGPVFSSMFLHANLTHLLGNLAFLAVFGTLVEQEVGSLRLVVLYFASGIAGALLHVVVDPGAGNAMVGCSGCLCGLIAVAAANNPRLLGFALGFIALNCWYAFTGTGESISFGAHLGGFVVGVLFAGIMRVTSFIREENHAQKLS